MKPCPMLGLGNCPPVTEMLCSSLCAATRFTRGTACHRYLQAIQELCLFNFTAFYSMVYAPVPFMY